MPVEIPPFTLYFFLSFFLIKAEDIDKIVVNSPDQFQKSPSPLSRQGPEYAVLLLTDDTREVVRGARIYYFLSCKRVAHAHCLSGTVYSDWADLSAKATGRLNKPHLPYRSQSIPQR